MGVLVANHCLSHEVVHVVSFFEVLVVDFRVDVVDALLVMQLLGQLVHVLVVGDVGVLRPDEHLVGPKNVLSVDRGGHLPLYLFHHLLCSFVLAQDNVDLPGDKSLVAGAELIQRSLGVLPHHLVNVPALQHS